MKQSVVKYVITDKFADAFLVRTSHYGFNADDGYPVFSIVFSQSMEEASFMSEELAKETLEGFFKIRYVVVQNENFKVDTQSLEVAPITITYEKDS